MPNFSRRTQGLMLVLVLLLVLEFSPAAHAQASLEQANYSVKVTDGPVIVSLNLRSYQNLTAREQSFSLPESHILVEGSNSSDVLLKVQEALQMKNPLARLNNLRMEVSSTAWSNVTIRQWFNVSLSFDLTGTHAVTRGVAKADMSWKSFALTAGLTLGGVEISSVGERYIAPIAAQIADEESEPSPFFTRVFIVNGRQVSVFRFGDAASDVKLLNFAALSAPVSQWQEAHVTLSNTRSWSFAEPDLGISFTRITSEPDEGELRLVYGLFYDLQATVVSPASSTVEGDVITVILTEFPETIMGLTILSVVAVGSGAFLYERRLLGMTVRKRTKH